MGTFLARGSSSEKPLALPHLGGREALQPSAADVGLGLRVGMSLEQAEHDPGGGSVLSGVRGSA